MSVTRVLVVDDHPIVRQGIRLLLREEPDLTVCAEAEHARAALEAAALHDPDVALVDLSLPGTSGLDLVRTLRTHHPRTAAVVLTMYDEELYAERALRAGARGYITKRNGPEQVVTAIRAVHAGRLHFSDRAVARILGRAAGAPVTSTSVVESLSDREFEIFQMIGAGLSTRDIAAALGLSIKTVESHRERIKKKLGIDSGSALVQHAVAWVQASPA